MKIQKNYDLTKLNTLGIFAHALYFTEIENETELKKLFTLSEYKQNKKVFLGGGSNILFTKDFDGIVVLNKLKGINVLKEDNENILVKSMSGEIWHDLVLFTVEHGYWGLENLSLIPGTVGGAPIQNIGAYGVELKDILENVEAYDVVSGLKRTFNKDECGFGYRESVFKSNLKNQYFISAITLKLSKIERPNISYKILSDYLQEHKIEVSSPKNISDAVSAIRRSKLPDPTIIGNAGSFFKNIFINEEKLENLLKSFPDIKYFREENQIKISAGWLIENCEWKGERVGNVGVHERHALVLVNYGGGSGQEIENLAQKIIHSVSLKFGLTLIPEVNFI